MTHLLHRTVVLLFAFFVAASLGTVTLTAVANAARELVGNGFGNTFPRTAGTGGDSLSPARRNISRTTFRGSGEGYAENTSSSHLGTNHLTGDLSAFSSGTRATDSGITAFASAVAPEPATLALLAFVGLGGIVIRKRAVR